MMKISPHKIGDVVSFYMMLVEYRSRVNTYISLETQSHTYIYVDHRVLYDAGGVPQGFIIIVSLPPFAGCLRPPCSRVEVIRENLKGTIADDNFDIPLLGVCAMPGFFLAGGNSRIYPIVESITLSIDEANV